MDRSKLRDIRLVVLDTLCKFITVEVSDRLLTDSGVQRLVQRLVHSAIGIC